MKARAPMASIGALVALTAVGAACGGGDDETRTVAAADYSFKNLPREVDAGTTLTLTNSSTKELHEMVVMRLADDEKRPVAELVNLPETEAEKVFAGEPAMVLVAPPNGGEMIKAVGDGKLTEKNRYAVICSIPIGADPAAFLAAMQSSREAPQCPRRPAPPHPGHVRRDHGEVAPTGRAPETAAPERSRRSSASGNLGRRRSVRRRTPHARLRAGRPRHRSQSTCVAFPTDDVFIHKTLS